MARAYQKNKRNPFPNGRQRPEEQIVVAVYQSIISQIGLKNNQDRVIILGKFSGLKDEIIINFFETNLPSEKEPSFATCFYTGNEDYDEQRYTANEGQHLFLIQQGIKFHQMIQSGEKPYYQFSKEKETAVPGYRYNGLEEFSQLNPPPSKRDEFAGRLVHVRSLTRNAPRRQQSFIRNFII